MLKQLVMRPAAGLVAVSLGIVAVGLVISRPAVVFPKTAAHEDGESWRLHRLAFLTAAYDRVEADLQRRAEDGGRVSLRREREAIVQLIRETARPLAAERVPTPVSELLQGPPAKPPPQAARADALITAPDRRAPVLEAGTAAFRKASLDVAVLALDPKLSLPLDATTARARRAKAVDPDPAAGADTHPARKATSGQGSTTEPRSADRVDRVKP